MPDYEEIIKLSQDNVKSLSIKLKDLDKLHQDIKELIKQPEMFEIKYQQIIKLTEDYTNTLGASTKKYLDGNNILFTARLSELGEKTAELQKEIGRLVNTDLTKLFQVLQQVFIDQTRKDLVEELNKFDTKSQDLQAKIDELKKQVARLEQIDLEKHFDKHQKTLSEIFGAINSINVVLTNLTQTLTITTQSLGTIQTSIDKGNNEVIRLINVVTDKIKFLENQNALLKGEIKSNKIIQLLGFLFVLIFLVYLAITIN